MNDVSLTLKAGEWIGFYGRNGCGKTTLLRLIAGLLEADRGTIERYGTISCFFALGAGFHEDKRATENIYTHGLLHGLHPSEIRAMTESIIAFSGTASHRDLPFKHLSHGMRARLAFAAAVHIDREIYLFDEALAVGDAAFQIVCKEKFIELKRQGKSGLIVDHSLGFLADICDRILHMEGGRIVREDRAPSS